MQRTAMIFLNKWLKEKGRKPLVLRGARQVGKTWLVRSLAEQHQLRLLELNFEKRPRLETFFESNDPHAILLHISSLFGGGAIDLQKTLLFLDEVQSFPEILSKLRWFAEDMPELAVIAAGSLLEFELDKHSFSMPVGRIGYMYLEPLSFEEFLLAGHHDGLVEYLKNYQLHQKIPLALHEQLVALFKEYLIVGGMPAAVASWTEKRSLQAIHLLHNDLISSYRDDFTRYKGRLDSEILDDVMLAVPKNLGKKFVYSKVNPLVQSPAIKKALDLLCKARLCSKTRATAANGVPLGAEVQDNYFKVIFLDVGLCSSILRLSLDQIISIREIDLINSVGIAEQVVGQLLRTIEPFYIDPALFYWHRERGGSAEVDYIMQHHNKIIPIEVKAGSTGGLKSLHVFIGLKKLPLAVRINSDVPVMSAVQIKDYQGNPVNYKLISLPFYLISEIYRLVEESKSNSF